MKEQIVSFETAKLLKEIRFNWKTLNWYDNKEELHINPIKNHNKEKFSISAPTQCLAQKWLREEYKVFILPDYNYYSDTYTFYLHSANKNYAPDEYSEYQENFDTYEDALEKGLQEAISMIIKQSK